MKEKKRPRPRRNPNTSKPDAEQITTLLAVGFFVAALRMRARDTGRQMCRPFDRMVATEGRGATVIVLSVAIATVLLHHAGGWPRVWAEWEQVGVTATFTAAAVFGWRRVRGIVPSAVKPRANTRQVPAMGCNCSGSTHAGGRAR